MDMFFGSQESILLSLKETIHLPNNLLAHIRPRTSLSRLGLLINFQHILLETISSEVPESLLYYNEKTPVYLNETGKTGSKIYTDFIGKVFRHYKGNYYLVENISMHSETKEYMVVYKTLYNNEDSNVWVRSASMFFEEIDPNLPNNVTGQKHRFELATEIEKDYTKN